MKNDLKIQLENFDSGKLTIKNFIDNVRKISEKTNENNLSKDDVIQEYLEQKEFEKQNLIRARNLEYYRKYCSNPQNRKRRSELDRKRYERNKSVGNLKN